MCAPFDKLETHLHESYLSKPSLYTVLLLNSQNLIKFS